MTARPNLVAVLRGTTAEGEPSEIALRILVETITRTIGLYGDPVEVECPHDEWPEEWDLGGRFTIEIGQTGDPDPEVITLGGYRLIRRTPVGFGAVRGSDPEEITPARYLVRLDTLWGFWRDARGGIIRQQTFNPLGPDGLVDTGSAQYRTVQQLVDYALNAMTGAEFPNDPAPSALDLAIDGVTTVVAPGPLDWGNARAMPELEALLAQVGWSAVFANDGQTLARASGAGRATFELPSWMAEFAEPYELTPVAGVRSSRIVITSGRTRTTMLSDRSLDGTAAPALVWCMQDEETGEWIDQTEAAQLAAFNAGPRGADGTTREFAKAFTAVRIAASEREALSAFVAIPQAPASGSWAAFTRSAVLVTMRGVAVEPGGELANVPASGDPIIVAGAAAIPGEGVIILPTSLRAARISGADRGAYAQAVALDGDDLTVVIAHESRSGEHLIDYYVSAWEISEDGGVLSVERLEDEAQAEAIFSPEVPKVEAPFLRRVMVWPAGDEDPTPVNDDDLHEAARQIALARGAADRAVVGTITLRGLHDVEPGGAGGAITAVTWDLFGQRTILAINQHEAPHSWWDMLEARAGRSIGGGLSRRTMPGSAVASTDSRDGSAPSDLAAIGGPEAAPRREGERASVEQAGRGRAAARVVAAQRGRGVPDGCGDHGLIEHRRQPLVVLVVAGGVHGLCVGGGQRRAEQRASEGVRSTRSRRPTTARASRGRGTTWIRRSIRRSRRSRSTPSPRARSCRWCGAEACGSSR